MGAVGGSCGFDNGDGSTDVVTGIVGTAVERNSRVLDAVVVVVVVVVVKCVTLYTNASVVK